MKDHIENAVARLQRIAAGDDIVEVYGTAELFLHPTRGYSRDEAHRRAVQLKRVDYGNLAMEFLLEHPDSTKEDA